jgi:hypothetical protein
MGHDSGEPVVPDGEFRHPNLNFMLLLLYNPSLQVYKVRTLVSKHAVESFFQSLHR